MQYRLLRNNIEYGPFSKDDLLLQGLQTTDQIKIVGENSWRAVSSYADFKTLLEPTSKPKYKFTADKQLVEIKTEDKPVANSKVINPDEPSSPSPFKRTPSAVPKKKVSGIVAPPGPIAGIHSAEPQKGVNRKENRHEPNQPYIKPNTVHHIEHAPKFEQHRSITPKTVKKKQAVANSSFTKEFILPVFIIGGIGCLFWWGYHKYSTGHETIGSGDSIAQVASTDSTDLNNQKPVAKDSIAKKVTVKATNTAKLSAAQIGKSDSLRKVEKQQHIHDSLATIPRKAAPPVLSALKDSPKAADKAVVKADPQKKAETPVEEAPKQQAPAKQQPAEVKTTKPVASSTKTAAKKASGITDYINMSLNKTPENGIKNIKIKVQNVSKEDLNIAVVEVKYYDAAGTFIKGETLQTGKISAGKSATLKVPNSKDASRISYKASLISGDNVYLMGK